MHSASRPSTSSILSPLAKPFIAERVDDYVQEQEKERESAVMNLVFNPAEREQELDQRWAALNIMMRDYETEDEKEHQPRTPSPPIAPAPVLGSPLRLGEVYPLTPAESVQPPVSVYDRASAPVVRVTKEIWEELGKEMDLLKKQKRQLERQLAIMEHEHNAHLDEDHDVDMQIGKLRYQNEANRDQKASMGRALSQKDVEIKRQQLDIDNLNKKIVDLEAEIIQCGQIRGEVDLLRGTISNKDDTLRELEQTIDRLIIERNTAVRAQAHAGEHATRAQNLVHTLTKREKVMIDQRQQLVDEKARVTDLEDEVERLREDQERLNSLEEELRETTSQRDRFRTLLKNTEQQLKVSQSRLNAAHSGGQALKGGAHLVAPNPKSTLPKMVMSCSECYALNLPCDNGPQCRNCVEGNRQCARWRCSMKHRLGECNLAPCVLPHDSQGWLIMPDGPRPEW
jgi:cell division protein FtsB